MGANLILDSYVIPNGEGWKSLCVFRPSFCSSHVAVAEGFFLCSEGFTPGGVRFVAARGDRDKVPDGAAKDALSWR
jgi:hypothetical protein